MGGIGGGNFNFLPSGLYNQLYINTTSAATAAPLCIVFEKRAGTVVSSNLQNAGSMTTTFTGYWPTVFMTYHQASLLDSVALKCFSPIVTGKGIASDNMNSSLPIAIYKFMLTNNTTSYDTAGIALSNGANSSAVTVNNRVVGIVGTNICVVVDSTKLNAGDSITYGNSSTSFTTSGILGNSGAGVLAKRIVVGPGSSRTITFCVSWTNVTAGYYTNYFTTAATAPQALATYGVDSAAILEAMVDNWHNKILNSNLPAWLQDLVINCLYVYNTNTQWTTPTANGITGSYGMTESMSSSGTSIGCNDQAYHGNFALSCFAPQAEWSQVARMTSSQQTNGLFDHMFGESGTDYRVDVGPKFIMEAYKIYQWTGNTANLTTMYPHIKSAIAGMRTLNTTTTDGLCDDNYFTTFDNPQSDGWVIPSKEYEDEQYIASLKAAANAAVAAGSPADTTAYKGRYDTVSASFERATSTTYASSGLWDSTTPTITGRLGHYTGSSNITNANGKAIWDGELLGQWAADVCGLGPIHPEGRIESSLLSIYDACIDHDNPPVYTIMMADANTNCTGATPTGTFCNMSGSPTSYITYLSYGAGELCVGFGHNEPDVSMRALQSFWNDYFSKYKRVYNMPCKEGIAGSGTDWGQDRYMNSPACFAALYGITGFTIDVNAKVLRLKPSLPDSSYYRMDSLISAPLINPISCGTLNYRRNTTVTPNVQRFVVRFDSPMQFNTFYTKKLFSQAVGVNKPAVGGSPVAATIAVNPADTSEYMVTFGSTLTIDSNGVLIVVGSSTVGTLYNGPTKATPVDFTVDTRRGVISYRLPQQETVTLSLVNSLGERILYVKEDANAGAHVVRYDWKNRPAGVYYAQFTAGEARSVKTVVYTK